MIAAITSKGRVFFTINRGKNTATTFTLFLLKVCQHLDTQDEHWRGKTTILLDNAPIHKSGEALRYQEKLGLSVMFLAPYSFEMAAVEKLFSFVKNRDLNPLSVRKYSK
jgi:transposase